ncbi:MAG: hypothetical protein KKD11_03220 [Candidatus Omnitrophica bacterium]|nr:hypothetical protein [Candidatus Omnitrophota bacterium]
MNIRLLRSLLAVALLIPLSSCTPATYSKERVEESIKNLCKKEYDLDVTTRITGSTLGVFIPVEGLIDKDLKLDQDAGEKIEDVALSIHRVSMSTDRPLKFYTLTARDIDMPGAEFVLTGHTYDVVRVRLLDISRGEYHKRILRDFRFNPVTAGEAKIAELFQALNENTPLVQTIKHIFYPIYTLGQDGTQKIEIIDIQSKEISEQESLFYVKTKEFYHPKPGFESYGAIFPPGFLNEYIILVNISMLPNPIKEIVAKYFYSGNEIRQRDLQKTFDQYKDIGYIAMDGLPKKALDEGWFLSRQITRRIKMTFEEEKNLRNRFTVQSSEGHIENRIFQFKFSISSEMPSLSKDDSEVIFSRILKLIAAVTHRYEFEDFEGVELIDARPDGKNIYLSRDDLERFRRGRLKIQDLI